MAAAEQVVTELVIDGSDIERASRLVGGAFDHMGDRATAAQAKMDAMVAKQLQVYGRDLPQSITRVEDAYARLQGKMDPIIAIQQRMEREMVQSLGVINRAVLLGVTTEEQATRDIARLKAQQIDAINRVRDAQRQAVVAVNDNDPYMAGGNAGFRRQNLGYQLFDIAQMQAIGQNPMMTLMQQGPQIAQLYAMQGGLNALWKDATGILGGLIRVAGPWIAAAAVLYGAYRLIASYGQEAALAIDDTTQALAAQAAPLSSVKSQIDELGTLQKTYRDAILSTGDSSTEATDKILANTKREFEAKKALLELESLRQEAALKVNAVEQQRQGLRLRQAIVGSDGNMFNPFGPTGVNPRMDLERQGFGDPRINGGLPFVRLPDEMTGVQRTQELIDKSPAAQKLKELRAEGELTRLTFERLQEALKATFDGTSLILDKAQRDPISGRLLSNLPMPTPRGIDDNPGSDDFMRDFERSSEKRIMQMQQEAKLLGQSGAATEALRYGLDALSDAYMKNIELAPDQIKTIKQQAEAYGKVVEALEKLKLIDDLQFDRSQLFRNSEDQSIASQLRGTGYGMDSDVANHIRRTNQLEGYRSLGIDLLSGIRDGALSGSENVGEAIMQGIADAATNYATKVSDKLIEDVITSGMKYFGMDDIGLTEQRAVAQMQVTAASVVITGGVGANILTGGAGIPALNNPANSNISGSNPNVGSTIDFARAAASASPNDVEAYIRQAAIARNIDPNIAIRVAQSEGGLRDPFRQGESMLSYGREESYGPFQLHMRNGGVGERALAAGIDPRTNWKGGVDFGLDEAAKKGWGQWFGAGKAGIGNRDGLEGAHAIGQFTEKLNEANPAVDTMTTSAISNAKSLGTLSGGFQKMGDALSQFPAAPAASGGGGGLFGWLGGLFGGGANTLPVFGHTGGVTAGGIGLYANGGIANRPSIFGEAGPEAAVPLPDGRRIPVEMRGAGRSSVKFEQTIVNNAGVQVRSEQEEDEDGNIKQTTYIDNMMTNVANKPGSRFNNMLRGRGAQPRRVRR